MFANITICRPCERTESNKDKIGTGKATVNTVNSRFVSAEQPCSKAQQVMYTEATLTSLWVNFWVGCKGVLDLALIVDTPHGLNHTIAQCSHLPRICSDFRLWATHTAMSTLYCRHFCSQMPHNIPFMTTMSLVMPEGQMPSYDGAKVSTDAKAMRESKWQKLACSW